VRHVEAKTVAEAAAKREAMRAEAASETEQQRRPRFAEYAESWLREKAPTVTVATSKWYGSVLEHHILPTFGEYYVDAIERDDVVRWRDAMKDETALVDGKRVQKNEPSTVNGRLRVLKTIMRSASLDLGVPDPTSRVGSLEEPDSNPKSLTLDEMRRLLAALEDAPKPWHAIASTMAYTGMRFGEVTALRWDAIGDTISIRRSQWRGHVGKTKTKRIRSVAVPRELADILQAHRAWMLREQHPGLASGYVFPSSTGTLLSNTGLRKQVTRAAKRAKLGKEPTPHWFRHTFNNLVRQHATGEVVRAMTGHTTEAMTEHYSHVRADEKLSAVTRALGLSSAQCVGQSVGHTNALDDTARES
jgi:integrase